jgi:hypothetical protein
MKKYIEIDNITFQVNNKINIKEMQELKTLGECYSRPSTRKAVIYNLWSNFAKNHFAGAYYGIASYNSMTFTFDALIEHQNRLYYIHITKSYNYIKEV